MTQSVHRWNTADFEARTQQLYRTELHKLYPSEAWALYRVLPHCRTVLDLGCGNGAMAAVVNQIAPQAAYRGMDHQANLMRAAKDAFPFAEFEAGDLTEYLARCVGADCVMSWSVVKSFANWRELIAAMIDKADKFAIFDMRVANIADEIFDDQLCWAEYGEIRGAHVLCNYNHLREAILANESQLTKVEIAGYQSRYGKNVRFTIPEPELFLISCVLHKRARDEKCAFETYEQLPANLDR